MSEDTELREYSRYAVFRKGTSNKFYQVRVIELENGQAEVLFVYGRLGTAGQTKKDGVAYDYDYGITRADEKFATKLKKGYQEERSSLKLLAMTVQEPEERKGHGLKPVVVACSMPWSASEKMRERLSKFAVKFLSKLNLVRKDKHALSEKQYEKQVCDLGKQYAAEYERICDSKGFGDDARCDDVKQAIVNYYRGLRVELGISSYHWPMRNFSFNTEIYD